MPKPQKKKRATTSKTRTARRPSVRKGGTHLSLYNSGREVWLYDEANSDEIRKSGALNFRSGPTGEDFSSLTGRGVIVGYSLHQDDELEIAVYVGDPFTKRELSVARWLEPQTALLRLPTGTLCVEPNDSCRVGPETPTANGGLVKVPAGDYRLTLYRIDHEALFRERLEWPGAQEVILLTPGGTPDDAVDDLLPFEDRRDLNWVGKYEIHGNRAQALAWFSDYWDTVVLNLDSKAAAKLSLAPGSYFRTHVPAAGVTLISAFAKSWSDAQRLPQPAGVSLEEYGHAAFSPMADWNGAEALFCRRETAKKRIENEHHDVWIPAEVEVLDPRVHPPAPRQPGSSGLTPTKLASKNYFDPGFLSLILSDVIPAAGEEDELPLPDALDMLDENLGETGLTPHVDLEWKQRNLRGEVEFACRLYAGLPDAFVAVVAGEGIFDLLVTTELEDGRWIVTGLADDLGVRLTAARKTGIPNEVIEVQSMDEALEAIFAAHAESVGDSDVSPVPSPRDGKEATAAFARFLGAAFGQ